MIIRINKQKSKVKHNSCDCKYKFDGKKCNKIHVSVNIDLMVKYVTQNKHRIMITVDVNIKNIEATYM